MGKKKHGKKHSDEARETRLSSAARTPQDAWDLHNHSVFSDGSLTVDELVAEARAIGLSHLAITDHDSLSQLSAVRARSRELDFPVLAGLEVSTRSAAYGIKPHILAFGLEATADASGPLELLCTKTCQLRAADTLWQAWMLGRMGAEFSGRHVSLDEVVAVAGESASVYRQHVMEALTRRPCTDPDYQFFFRCWFKETLGPKRLISYPEPADAVRAIREQGGVPVLAHPGQTKAWRLIDELVDAGLMGIEVMHPDHGPVDVALALDAARDHKLIITGGSDYHGKYGKVPSLGGAYLMPDEVPDAVAEFFECEQHLA